MHNKQSICNPSQQVSAVADEPARRAASRQTCCKQRRTLSVINMRTNLSWQHLRWSTCHSDKGGKSAILTYLTLYLAPPLVMTS